MSKDQQAEEAPRQVRGGETLAFPLKAALWLCESSRDGGRGRLGDMGVGNRMILAQGKKKRLLLTHMKPKQGDLPGGPVARRLALNEGPGGLRLPPGWELDPTCFN